MTNPFEFGRELSALEIVDREEEVGQVVQTIMETGRLFVIGPRRFGKTSILRAAAEKANASGAVVFRYNAEAYPNLTVLSERIVADAAAHLTGPVRKAGRRIQEIFGSLRPQVTYDPIGDQFAVSLATEMKHQAGPALLSETLAGLDALAASSKKPVAVIIDEFQKIVEDDGVQAEGQLRAAVQAHDHVGYVFAGSKTRLLSEMTGDEGRPFYRLGSRLFIGPVPRDDFQRFISAGFSDAGLYIEPDGISEILDRADDVPYNVQRLAHACWTEAQARKAPVTPEIVKRVLETLVRRDDPFYTQIWNRTSPTQKQALLAIANEEGSGAGLFSAEVLQAYGVKSVSTMRTAAQALVSNGIAREEERGGKTAYRLEDPFFAVWLALFIAHP
ncbi:MAG: AAA family ATPase [Rhodothermales bacterium]